MVDDQPARLLTYESILSGLPIQCVRALSGTEALQQLLKREFAVILLDVSMPEMDGFELARLIREHPRLERTPIIFITGVHITELDRLKGYEVGAIDYISVPVVSEILRSKVALLVELHLRRRELQTLNAALSEARTRRDVEHADALAAHQAQLRGCFDHPDQVAMIVCAERDRSGLVSDLICRDANTNAQSILGHTRETLIGKRLSEILPQHSQQAVALARTALETARPARYEMRVGNVDLRAVIYGTGRDTLVISAVEIADRERTPQALPLTTEQALHDEAERFRVITETIPQLVWSARADGYCDYYNRRFLQYLGIDLRSMHGDAWVDTVHPHDRTAAVAAWREAISGGTEYASEFRMRRGSDGEYRWHLVRGESLRDADGNVVRWFGTCTDVHDLKRAEQALAESERRYRTLVEHAPVGVCHASLDGRLEYVNAAFCSLLGYTRAELRLKSWQELTHPEDLEADTALARRVLTQELPHYTLQKRYIRRDGTAVWTELFGSFVFDEAGQPLQGIGVVIGIDARLRADTALRASQERLWVAKQAARLGTFDWDIQADTLLWDERTHELWGIEPSGAIDLAAFFSQVHPDDHAVAQQAIDRSFDLHGNHVLSALYRVINRLDGETRWVEATGRVYFDGERPARMVGVVQEVTERVLSQQKLADSELRFRELANHIDQIVWTCDMLGQPTWYNYRWFEYTGISPEHMSQDGWQIVMHPED
ncbi:MAG: PAS domain S-box protein, partial [Sinobacteraceae bacterium]|nr:PAS domain S-box protein [Nevskiaceae bacterium]